MLYSGFAGLVHSFMTLLSGTDCCTCGSKKEDDDDVEGAEEDRHGGVEMRYVNPTGGSSLKQMKAMEARLKKLEAIASVNGNVDNLNAKQIGSWEVE